MCKVSVWARLHRHLDQGETLSRVTLYLRQDFAHLHDVLSQSQKGHNTEINTGVCIFTVSALVNALKRIIWLDYRLGRVTSSAGFYTWLWSVGQFKLA